MRIYLPKHIIQCFEHLNPNSSIRDYTLNLGLEVQVIKAGESDHVGVIMSLLIGCASGWQGVADWPRWQHKQDPLLYGDLHRQVIGQICQELASL